MKPDTTVRAGSSLSFTVAQGDDTSITCTVIMERITPDDGRIITDTQPFVDGVAAFEISTTALDIGLYEYQLNENFATGDPDIYPDSDKCKGDCKFPTIQICESLPRGS